ncbi:hypothetical protein GF337_13555 [candidate division KSB1 bacterium]|nr:hypothetical protein [candidate division KSB1 bacterium]
MKKIFIYLLAIFFIAGCEKDKPTGLYVSSKEYNEPPTISRIEPSDSTLAGIGEFTVFGSNMPENPDEVVVYANNMFAPVLSANSTSVTCKAPNLVSDSVMIRVAARGALEFSNMLQYKLSTAIWEIGEFAETNEKSVYAIACDKDENVYISIDSEKKIFKIQPNGETSIFAQVPKASGMKIGPDGYLYYVNLVPFLLRIPPEGGTMEAFARMPGGVYDLDFDENGNVYCGGGGFAIYRARPDKSTDTVAEYPDVFILSVRVYNGYVYISGKYNGENESHPKQGIWRNQILDADGNLGENELVFDWSSQFESNLSSITFSETGDMYIGTDAEEAIIILHEDGSTEAMYHGLIFPETYDLVWGNGQYLYVSRRNELITKRAVVKINMLHAGAPYYGRI